MGYVCMMTEGDMKAISDIAKEVTNFKEFSMSMDANPREIELLERKLLIEMTIILQNNLKNCMAALPHEEAHIRRSLGLTR